MQERRKELKRGKKYIWKVMEIFILVLVMALFWYKYLKTIDYMPAISQ